MSVTLSSKKKERILYFSRAAGFYQTELLLALQTMEDLLQIYPQPKWDVVSRLLEVGPYFPTRISTCPISNSFLVDYIQLAKNKYSN